MSSSGDIRHFFQNVQKRVENTAQRRLTEMLPGIMSALHDYVKDEEANGNFSDMTGNWINSFGVAAYRDGRCFAIANMSGEENAPIRTTLIEGDWFKKGERRFDKSTQKRTFEIDGNKYHGAADQVFYNEEVLAWLGRTRTTRKGFSFRVVTVTEYHRPEARKALLRLSDELEQKGGIIWNFHIG
jgi:hypothetical protein